MKSNNLKKALVYAFIIGFAICPTFAFDSKNRNLLLVGLMALAPLIFLIYRGFYKTDVLLLLFIGTLVLFPIMFHPDSIRWSTVLYSCLYCLSFMAYTRLLRIRTFTLQNYQNLLKYILYAYAITLVIQQISVLAGLPIFNLRFYDPNEPWKLNSLGAEPSWAGRIVGLLMYCFLTIKEITNERRYNFRLDFGTDKWIWISFLWAMLTMGSATALIFIGIVSIKLIRFRNLVPLAILLIVFFYFADKIQNSAMQRTKKTIMATLTLDENTIIKADHSASFRIVPLIVLTKKLQLSTADDWFGYGVDYISNHIDLKVPGSKNQSGGGFVGVFIEYGFIAFFIFMLFSLSVAINKDDLTSIIFWFMLVFIYGLNVQIPWLAIMLLYTNKYFLKQSSAKYLMYGKEKELH